jgi:glycosyltransferase involved in cell wall biosynthesis
LVARLFKVKKVVHTYHGLIYRNYFNSLFSQLIVFLDRLSARKTDVIISLSESQKRELVDLYHISTEKLIKVIPLSIAQKAADFTEAKAKAFKQRWKIPDEVIVVSQVGRITKVKNNQLLLDFFAKIRKEFTAPILLVIAGDGELKASLIDRAMALGLNVGETADAFVEVLFTSWCTHLDQLYSATDIVVLTSLSEGTPLSIIEAQMAGVAVLSAKVGGVQDLIEEGFSGLLFSNQEEFEYKFKQLLNSEALRVSIGTNAAKFAASKFSEAKMLQQYDQIYKII